MCVLFWIACPSVQAQMNEGQALAAIKFNQPVAVSFSTAYILDGQGNLNSTLDTQIISLLNKSGHFLVVPNMATRPWWNFALGGSGGTVNGVIVDIPVGKRLITKRSAKEGWSEGSIKFYAQTITYMIEFDNNIKPLIGRNLTELTLRVVEYRDPAVGNWQLLTGTNRGTRYNHNESSLVQKTLAAAGTQYLDVTRGNIASAIQTSHNATQNQLAASGIVEKGPFPGTLLIKKYDLLLYLGDTFPAQPGVTIGRLKQYCSDVRVGNTRWRLPTFNELQKLTQEARLDTPDHRLWGDVGGMFIPADNFNLRFNYGGNKNYFEGQAFVMEPITSQFQFAHRGASISGPTVDSGIINGSQVQALCIASNEPQKPSGSDQESVQATVPQTNTKSGELSVPSPPPAPAPAPKTPLAFSFYPRLGQSEEQQSRDNYDCTNWAIRVTGYDPQQSQQSDRQKNLNFQKALGACLEGRGYTVKRK